MRRRLPATVLCAAALAVAVAACGGDASPASPSPTPSATVRPSPTATEPPAATATPTLAPPTAAPTSEPPQGRAQVISRGPAGRDAVALTFDAGSDTGYTSAILDILRGENIRAGFGITGRWAEANPGLVRRMVDERHELINHSYDHPSFTGLSTNSAPLTREQRWAQLDRTEEIIVALTDASPKPYFRPPYGDYDDSVLSDVGAHGYAYSVMWTVDSRGWQGFAADQIVQRCLDLAEPGAIYIFHVGSESQDAAALQRVIDGLRLRGYEFVTISDLIGY